MSERAPIQVSTRFPSPGVALVAAAGDIGYHEAPTLRQAIKEAYDAKPARVIVDLAGVAYMATPGLATLVEALQMSKRSQVALVLCGLNERVRAVFEIARLHTVFRIVPDASAALSV
jgi:anti-sigma B factor antagonist